MMPNPMYFQVRMKKIVHSAMAGSASQLPLQVAEADGLERRVDGAVGLQEQLPRESRDDLGEDVRDEDEQPERAAALEAAVEQQGDRDGDRALDEQRHREDEEVVADRAGELRRA